jgi:hypothetical protein
MIENIKPAESLTVADFQAHPVWEFLNDDEIGETMVQPVEMIPVKTLDNRLIGTQVRLANGSQVWALIGNFDVTNPRAGAARTGSRIAPMGRAAPGRFAPGGRDAIYAGGGGQGHPDTADHRNAGMYPRPDGIFETILAGLHCRRYRPTPARRPSW